MNCLQDLYDFYIQTKPSRGKLKAASSMLIHVCKALNQVSAEQVTPDFYKEIPPAIDLYYKSSKNLAIQDKSILSEMIGRYGPKDGWEKAFEVLLKDEDENLRQFTLHSLEYITAQQPDLVIKYIEEYKNSSDSMLREVTVHLVENLLCSDQNLLIKGKLMEWNQLGEQHFLKEVVRGFKKVVDNQHKISAERDCRVAYDWLVKNFNL